MMLRDMGYNNHQYNLRQGFN